MEQDKAQQDETRTSVRERGKRGLIAPDARDSRCRGTIKCTLAGREKVHLSQIWIVELNSRDRATWMEYTTESPSVRGWILHAQGRYASDTLAVRILYKTTAVRTRESNRKKKNCTIKF